MARKISIGIVTRSLGTINFVDNILTTSSLSESIILSPQPGGTVDVDANLQLLDGRSARFFDNDSSNYVEFVSPSALSGDTIYRLPQSDGSSNQVLTTDGSGNMSWTTKTVIIQNDDDNTGVVYPTFTAFTGGDQSTLNVSSSKIQFVPSTGTFTSLVLAANGGAESTSTSTGSLIVAGGAGISGDINAGGIQNTPIGDTTRSSGAFTTLTSNSATTVTASTASTTTGTGALVVSGGVGVGGNIVAGGIQNTPIGNTTRNSGAFTTLTSNGATTLTSNVASTTTGTGALVVTGGIGSGGQITAVNLVAVATTASTSTTTGSIIASGGVGVAGAIFAGSIQATPIGNTTRSSGAFTTLTANSSVSLTQNTGSTSTTTGTLIVTGGVGISERLYAGSIQNTPIGTVTRSTGAFTTLTSNAATTFTQNSAATSTTTGTLRVTGGVGISQRLYVGGGIQASPIGTVTRSSGAFTSLTANSTTSVTATTASTSTTTGALTVSGGVGVAGRVTANNIVANANTASTSNTTGTIVVTGGIGISGQVSSATVLTSGNSRARSLGVGTNASGTAGEIRATNNVTAFFSDDRLKTRLGKIENALDKVDSLNGFYFVPNETAVSLGYEAKKQVGVSAQEVQAILPEIIAEAPIDSQYMTVYYDKLTPLLIEAIKELRAEINQLKKG